MGGCRPHSFANPCGPNNIPDCTPLSPLGFGENCLLGGWWDEFDTMNIPVVVVGWGWIPWTAASGVDAPSIIDGQGTVLGVTSYWGMTTTQIGTGLIDWSWWSTFFQNVGHNLVHGIRKPGESFGSCFYYNANATTGGAIGQIGAAAAALAPFAMAATAQVANVFKGDPEFPGETISLNMRMAVPAAIQIGVWTANATGNFATAATVANGSFLAIYNGTLGLGYAGAVVGGAALGTVIGSAINCR